MTRQAYVLLEYRLIVFWTEKAACTSIVHALCDQVIGLETISRLPERGGRRNQLRNTALRTAERILNVPVENRWTLQKDRRRWLVANGYYMRGDDAAERALREDFRTIGMIRDPYDRLISAFQNKFVFYKGKPLQEIVDLEWFARNLYLERHKICGIPADTLYEGLSFHDMVTHVCDMIDDPAVSETHLNNHWNTQIPDSFARDRFKYDHLYEINRSDAFFECLSDLIGKKIENAHYNQSRWVEQKTHSRENLVHVKSTRLGGMGSLNKAAFEDVGLRSRVAKSFANDYAYYAQVAATPS